VAVTTAQRHNRIREITPLTGCGRDKVPEDGLGDGGLTNLEPTTPGRGHKSEAHAATVLPALRAALIAAKEYKKNMSAGQNSIQ
jgi:hypothetical protein